MSEVDDKLMRRLRKLLALAERGIDGEKDTAQKMLDKLLAKHDLTIEDISGDKKTDHWFKFGSKVVYRRLMRQIILSVVGNVDFYTSSVDKTIFIVEVTDFEKIEIEMKFSVYKKTLDKELEESFVAFVHKHELFAPANPDDDVEQDNSPEARAERARLRAKIDGMREVSINPALEHKA
jgi:hypothetical protein